MIADSLGIASILVADSCTPVFRLIGDRLKIVADSHSHDNNMSSNRGCYVGYEGIYQVSDIGKFYEGLYVKLRTKR